MSTPPHKKRPADFNQQAYQVFQEAIGEALTPITISTKDTSEKIVPSVAISLAEKNPHAVEMGKLGGSKGGKARAQRLTPERRREIARKAALARWRKSSD